MFRPSKKRKKRRALHKESKIQEKAILLRSAAAFSKEEKIVTINTNTANCVFKLPVMAALMEAKDGRIQFIEIMNQQSLELFNKAREGQGFATIEIVYKDLSKDQWIKETFLIPAFYRNDGLAKYDMEGRGYGYDSVYSSAKVGQSGSGVIHSKARKVSLIMQKLSTREDKDELIKKSAEFYEGDVDFLMEQLSINSDISGCVLGGAIVKGAESRDQKDYKIHILKPTENDADIHVIAHIKNSYSNGIKIAQEKLDPLLLKKFGNLTDRHLFLIPKDNAESFEVYYIRNNTFVRAATKIGVSEVSQDNIDSYLKDMEKSPAARQHIVDECLRALTIYNPFIQNNKSASQNKLSIFNDPDFESFIMFRDPERYLLDDKKQVMPEGHEWGSFFDFTRSESLILSNALRDQLIKSLNIEDPKIIDSIKKQQYAKCSSWDAEQHPYDKVIEDYHNSSDEDKIQMYEKNIHILLRLFEKTIIMYEDKDLIWEEKWDIQQVEKYLSDLENRLIQLLISRRRLRDTLNFDTKFESPLFEGDHSSLTELLKAFKGLPTENMGIKKRVDRIRDLCHQSLATLCAPYKEELEQKIYSLREPRASLKTFNIILEKAKLGRIDEKQIQRLLIKHQVLEPLINDANYRVALMVLSYGGINPIILKNVTEMLIIRIKKEIIQQQDPIPGDQTSLILDDFLRSFVRQICNQAHSCPPELTTLITENEKFLPKTTKLLKEQLEEKLDGEKEKQKMEATAQGIQKLAL